MDMGDFNMVGHESGQLLNITYPTMELHGYKLKSFWDDYGLCGVTPDDTYPTYIFYPDFPSNWSTVDLDQPYCRDSPSRPWVSKRIWRTLQ